MSEVDHSLRRLGTDYIDLSQIHRNDTTTPLEETLEALHDVVKAGKVRYLGASSMHASEFAKALHTQREHGEPGSSRCRTTTTCSPARRSARCCRSAPMRASVPSSGAPSPAVVLPRPYADAKGTARSENDGSADMLYTPLTADSDRRSSTPSAKSPRPRRAACADRARAAAHQPGRHGADRRRCVPTHGHRTADVLQHPRVHQPPAPVKNLGHLRLGDQLRRLHIHHHQTGGGVQQSGTCLRRVSPSRPDTQNGWLAIHRTAGSKAAARPGPARAGSRTQSGTGCGGPRPPGIVPLPLVHRKGSNWTAAHHRRPVNLGQRGRDPLTAAVKVAELHVR
jgi:hypothetical protein